MSLLNFGKFGLTFSLQTFDTNSFAYIKLESSQTIFKEANLLLEPQNYYSQLYIERAKTKEIAVNKETLEKLKELDMRANDLEEVPVFMNEISNSTFILDQLWRSQRIFGFLDMVLWFGNQDFSMAKF